MKCWHCGKELREGQPFCDQCGAEQRHAPESDLGDVGTEQKNIGLSGGSNWDSSTPPSPGKGLKMAGLAFAVLYTVVAGNLIASMVMNAVRIVATIFIEAEFIYPVFDLVTETIQVILTLPLIACLLMLAFRKTEENWDGLMLGLTAILTVRVLVWVILRLLNMILLRVQLSGMGIFLEDIPRMILFGVLAVAVLGAVGVSGGAPILVIHRDRDALKASLYTAAADAQTAIQEVAGRLSAKFSGGVRSSNPPYHGYTFQDQTNQGYPHYQAPDQGRYTYQGYGTPYQTPYGAAGFRLQEDRRLLTYLLLNLVTCGIYSWYFIYCWAWDVNIACDGDGRHTGGLLAWILLGLVTLGFYPLYWYYALGSRLQMNGSRYGVEIRESGGIILLWMVVGLLTCGLGSLYGLYLLLKNTNLICAAYNRSCGM